MKRSLLYVTAILMLLARVASLHPMPRPQTEITVSVNPGLYGIAAAQSLTIVATVTNDSSNSGVTWSVSGNNCSGSGCGTLSQTTASSTAYTGPVIGGVYIVTAASVANPSSSASAQIAVTDLGGVYTYRHNLTAAGINNKEYLLTPSTVNANSFGKLFSCSVDEDVYAQPLWVANASIGGGTHNVVIVATENDSVYAFDADGNNGTACIQYWKASLLTSSYGAASGATPIPPMDTGETQDLNTNIGITSTPVIDPSTNTLYVESNTKENNDYFQRLHALNLVTGVENPGWPITISASVSGTGDGSSGGSLPFIALNENQRPGLALVNGTVWMTFASHGDVAPWHGWVIGYNTATRALTGALATTPNSYGGGIWMVGSAPAVDSSNNLYVITGNGIYDGTTEFGDSFLKLSTSNGIAISDWFTPDDQLTLNGNDLDLGSGGAITLLDSVPGPNPHLLIGGGKEGILYLLNRDNMGHFNSNNNAVIQTLNMGHGIFAAGAFWQNAFYMAPVRSPMQAFAFNTGTGLFNTNPTSQSPNTFAFPGATPEISASGSTNGIVWAVDTSGNGTNHALTGPAVLYAYDVTALGTELWDSTQKTPQGASNQAPNAVKFVIPTVANGKVYLGAVNSLTVYGLLNLSTPDTAPPAPPSNLTATAASSIQINLSWTASTDNVAVTDYKVERCQGTGCTNFAPIGTSTSASYSDTGLTASTSYSYRVRATDGAGNLSGYSNAATAATATPDTMPPSAPSNVTATAATSTQINLSWTASTDNLGVTGYFIERCQGSGCSTFTQIATTTATSYSNTGLTAGTSYSYRVRATDAAGNLGSYSNVASATTTANTSPGLVAAYSFNEGTGTTVTDSAGNGNNGTISNAAWTTSGKYGNAIVFNGTSSLVTINDSVSLHLTTGMTLEAWVYATAAHGGWVDVVYKQNDNFLLEASSTVGAGPTGGGTFGNGFQSVAGPSALSLNIWTHIAVTFDGANIRVWINGVNVASKAQTSPLTTSTLPLQIGGDSLYGQYFTGRIDEVRIYNRALSQTDLQADMNSPIGPTGDTIPPTAPSNLTGTASGGTQINLSWTASTDNVGVTGYMVERCQGMGCTSFTQMASPSVTSYSDTGVATGTTYSYRVRATDAAGNLSGYSNVATATTLVPDTTPPTVPSNLTAYAGGPAPFVIARQSYINTNALTTHTTVPFDSTGGDLMVILGSSYGGVTFTLSDSYNNTWITAAGPTNHSTVDLLSQVWYAKTPAVGTGHTVTMTLSSGQPLVVSTLVIKGSNTAAPIDVISAITDDGGTATNTITSAAITTAQPADLLIDFAKVNNGVTWTAGTGYLFDSAASSNYLGGEDAVAPGDTSYTATWTTDLTVSWQNVLLGVSSANTGTSASQITMTWSPSTDNVGVTGYLVERCSGPACSNFAQIANTTATIYTDPSLSAGSQYSYRIRATDAAGNFSAYSNTAGATTTSGLDSIPPAAPSNLSAPASGGTQINLSWTASTDNVGATGYMVERCQGAGCSSFTQIGTSTSASYSDSGLTSATSYSYRVRATDAAGNLSTYSNTASAVTMDTIPPTAPSSLTATASGGTLINLSWAASTDNVGVTNYLVERCQGTACTSFLQIASPTGTTYSDTGLTSAVSYSYRVRATDTAGNLSGYSNTAGATTADIIPPSAPSNLTATAPTSTQINLFWMASTDNVGVTGYLVERCPGSGCTSFTQIGSPSGTGYSDTGLTTGTTYSYRVRATDAVGNLSGYSNAATATTPVPDTTPPTAPSNLTATASGAATINLAWTASTDNLGVTGYFIERCQGSGCSTFTQIATTTATSYSNTGLIAGTSYSYRVRATDAAGNLGSYSNVASATTAANTGLVAAYSFNEGTGTTVADSSGNGNNGTMSNAAWTTSGKYGNAIVFNGTSSLVTINDSVSLHLTTGMTLEAWVYATAAHGGWVDVVYKQNDKFLLEASSPVGAGPTGGGTFGNGFQGVAGPSALSLNIWTHIAVTFDGANIRVWVNGVNVASKAQTSPLTTSTLPLQIGGDSLYGQYFTGRIDEVRIYNRALSQTDLQADMNSSIGSTGDTTPPTAPTNLQAFAGGAPASVIARQSYINTTNKSTNTTATFNSTGGDLIVVFGSTHKAVATMTISDNKGNTWISAAGATNHSNSSVDLRSQIWYAKAAKVGTGHTVTITLSTANSLVISVLVIKGSNTTAPLDVTSPLTDNGATTTTTVTSATIATIKPGDMLIDFARTPVGVTWTAASGYTFESTASSNYLGAEDGLAGAAGSYNAAWTMSPAANWQNVLTSVVSVNASVSNSQITMMWNPSTDNVGVTGYVIERCTGAGCTNFSQVGSTVGFSTTSFADTGLSRGTTYTYRLRATDAAGNLSSYSNAATTATTP